MIDLLGLSRREPVALRLGILGETLLALSQQQALKGPLSKPNWIGHAIRSERHKLLTEGSLEFEIPFEITKGIASLHDYPRGVECLCQRLKRLRVVRINLGAHYSPHALQAGVLGSQPSAPVTALTGDSAVCAFLRRIASQEMGAAVGAQDNRVWVRSGSLADNVTSPRHVRFTQ
jgi:hypothetical protein